MIARLQTLDVRLRTALVAIPGLALAAVPLAGPLLMLLALAAWVGFAFPGFSIAVLAGIISTNLADVAVNRHGLPPVGALIVPALAGVLVVRALAGREDLSAAARLVVPAATYFCVMALALFWVPDRGPTLAYLADLARNLLIVLVFVGFLTDLDRFRIVLQTVAVAVAALAALSVWQFATGGFDNNYFGFAQARVRQIAGQLSYWRLSGPLPDPNFFAQLLVLSLPLMAAQVYVARAPILRVLGLVAPPIMVAAIVFTYSRGGLFALLAMLAFAVLMLRQRLIVAGVAAALIVLVLASGAVTDRVAPVWQALAALIEGGDVVSDPAIGERLAAQTAAINMFGQNPLAGIGPGQFPHLYGSYALLRGLDPGAEPYAHNLYLEIAAEGGIIGFALFLITAAVPIALARRAARRMAAVGRPREAVLTLALIVGFVGYLATAVFLHGAYPRFFWFEIALLLSSWAAIRRAPSTSPPADPPHRRSVMQFDKTLLVDAARGIWRVKLVVLIVTLGFGGLAAWQVSKTPQIHSAEARLFYRFGREYFPVSPGEQRRNWGENIQVSLEDALFTEMHLIRTWDLVRRTAATLDPQELQPEESGATVSSDATAPARTDAAPAAAEASPASPGTQPDEEVLRSMTNELASLIHVWRVQGTTLLAVSVRHQDPAYADELLTQHLEMYLQRRQELFTPSHDAFFETRAEQARADYAAASAEIEALREEWNVRDVAADRRLLTDRAAYFGQQANEAPRDGEILDRAAEARAALERLNRFEDALAPLEARRSALAEHIARLEQERQAASLTDSFWGNVASSVEVVDRRAAAETLVGMSPVPRVAGATMLGFLTATGLAAGAGLLFRRTDSDRDGRAVGA